MPSREPLGALQIDSAVAAALARLGLCRPGDAPRVTPLAGGVSSDIMRVELPGGPICVKRALAKLKVNADWFAPVERNAAEAAYMRYVSRIVPHAVPRLLGEDRAAGLFAMEYLAPEQYPVWKAQLRDGAISTDTACAVADVLAGTKMVAEGIRTTEAALALAARYGVELPIAAQVGELLAGRTDPNTALCDLMLRPQRAENG